LWITVLLSAAILTFAFSPALAVSILAVMAVGVVSCMLLVLAGAYDSDYLTSEYLPYFLPLGFSEAWLSGMLSTLFAVYRPELLADFEDAQFFGRK